MGWYPFCMEVRALLFLVQSDVEKVDPRGRTPLHLAVTLGRTKCVKLLLDHGADVMATNRHQWSGMQGSSCVPTVTHAAF